MVIGESYFVLQRVRAGRKPCWNRRLSMVRICVENAESSVRKFLLPAFADRSPEQAFPDENFVLNQMKAGGVGRGYFAC